MRNSAECRILIFIRKINSFVRHLWEIPFLRYLVVGGINTIFSYALFTILTLLQLHFVLATLLMYICSIIFNFKTHGVITFRNKSNQLIFRFLCVFIFLYLLNIGLLKIFDLYSINILVAQAILTLPIAFTSYLLMKKFVFFFFL